MKAKTSLGQLMARMAGQPVRLIIILFGSICQVLLSVYLPVLIGQAVDAVLLEGNVFFLVRILLIMALVIIINTVVQFILPILVNQLITRMMSELREEVYEKIHALPLSYLDRQSIGDLVARLASDSEQLSNGLNMIFSQFLTGVLTIVLTIFSMARLDRGMMILVVVLTPFSLFVARFIAKKSYVYYQQQTESRGQQTKLLEESIRQLSLIQTFNAQEQFISKFERSNQTYATYSQAAIFASSTSNPMTRFINALIYALLAGLGAMRIMAGSFTVGELTTFLNYASQYTKPFNDISSVLSELQSALVCAERLFKLLEQRSVEDGDVDALIEEEVAGHIQFEEVAFSYNPPQPLIENLTVDVPAGARIAIVGPTGAGKSTIINLLMRFYEVDKGRILLDGVPISRYSRADFRRQIGMVLQETWIKTGTIHENIAYDYPDVTRDRVIEAAKAANADFFIRQLPQGYDTELRDGGSALSQGQRQLLSIARVFVHLPKILILDEATSSIDTRTEALVQQAFERLMQGRTSFIIAHRLSTIQSADLILVMVAGQIVEQGNHDQLMQAKGVYYRMQTSQIVEE
ncbi:ABC transporter ATP-binding protein [Streptococcus acidominimus]|uniref:ABC transporter ATP-binding protein n=1 Tax=Streptococcus acidominimus TaxID=1326 RepID=A0A4Y9FNU6_STRAI|nr:ABC transporter ATP-binding protein [Streptococcus acidominimus]MBF0818854.1 ABC transporter ATP-binding protein [Streptococcus acidominimus]MBF0839604.1 ABC transporter ATP-binding protein [Streptococcus acidominimus]MBF0849268.1 ABC transporter ATP-binding protein [Streptococcus danieliae]TFU30696.1 ABC transporter ATP-binding protein [Streptococcus acidominimus]